jgi:flagella basal body P-ring formation protein FlgA
LLAFANSEAPSTSPETAQLQALDEIKKGVSDFLESQAQGSVNGHVQVEVGEIDPRLQLKKCAKPLTYELPNNMNVTNTSSVGVKCNTADAWAIYVPVSLKALIPIVVAQQPMSKGMIINPNMVSLKETDINKIRNGYFQKLDDVLGMEIKRPVYAGEVLSPEAINLPTIIHKGDEVTITAKIHTLTVTTIGIAMGDAAQGDRIQVQNKASGRVIDAVVTGKQQVQSLVPGAGPQPEQKVN